MRFSCTPELLHYAFISFFKWIYIHIAHLQQQCHNSKSVIFQEKLLKVLKYYSFLWVQWWHNCSPVASFANCVMTLYLLKVHLQMFLSIPITLKSQILNCDILVANEQYIYIYMYVCGNYESSWLWGVHVFDDVHNILGTSFITWWHMNQRFEAACCKICSHLLKDGQTQNQLALCNGLQEQAKKERGFHSKFRAGDESWVCGYDPGTMQQSSQWKSHPPAIKESWPS